MLIKKYTTIIAFALAIPMGMAFAPTKAAKEFKHENLLCSISGHNVKGSFSVSQPSDLAMQRVSQILNVVGLGKNFSVMAASVNNASAMIKGSNRYILYNPSFMQNVRNAGGHDWTSYSILAHEIGHHLNGHTIQAGGSKPAIELEADEFSGFVLRKMGAGLKEAQTAMALISDNKGSKTHPPRKQRLAAIAKGWHQADAQMKSKSK